MKVLQLAKHFYPDPGGIETVTQALSGMLTSQGIRTDVLCTRVRSQRYGKLDLPYKVIRSAVDIQLGNKVLSIDYVRHVKDLVDDYDLAILHLPNPLGALAAWLYWHKPLILYWHADVPQRSIRTLLSPLDRALIARARLVISPTVAHTDYSYFADLLVPKRKVIALPLDTKRLATCERSARVAEIEGWVDGRPMILAVGRLVPYKGLPILLDSAKSVDAAVVIAGSGPMQEELQQTIDAEDLGGRVMLCGGLRDGELACLFSGATIFCMPSITAAEMYGMVQVEAMAFSKPIVSTAIPRSGVSHVNIHDKTGLIVPPGDARALANALNAILKDARLRERLARGAQETFERDHDMRRLSEAYTQLVQNAAAASALTAVPV